MSDRDTKYPRTSQRVPLRTFGDLMHLSQHQADGTFELDGREIKFSVSSVIPGGSLCLLIENGDDQDNYFLSVHEFVESAIEHYKKTASLKE